MRVTFAEIGGITTRYFHWGESYPLLLLHGAGVSADTWMRNIDALGADFRVLAPDTLGHGFTGNGDYREGPPAPFVIEHLKAFVDHMKLDRFSVAGSSYGAVMAILLYFEMRERIEKLVLVSSGSSTLSEEEGLKVRKESFANGISAIADPTLASCRKRMENIFYDPAAVPDELIFMQLTMYALPGVCEMYEARMKGNMDLEAARPYRVAERLHEIEVPTLMLFGRNDPRVDFAKAEEAAASIAQSRLIGLDKCKHHPHVEHPQQFNALVRQFLTGTVLEDLDASGVAAS